MSISLYQTNINGTIKFKNENKQIETHVISSIVHIGHKYDNESVPWPLQIEDHFGKMHDVVLKAGEVNLTSYFIFQILFCRFFPYFFVYIFSIYSYFNSCFHLNFHLYFHFYFHSHFHCIIIYIYSHLYFHYMSIYIFVCILIYVL